MSNIFGKGICRLNRAALRCQTYWAPGANPGALPMTTCLNGLSSRQFGTDVESRAATAVDFVAVKASRFNSFQQHARILPTLSQACSRLSWPSTPTFCDRESMERGRRCDGKVDDRVLHASERGTRQSRILAYGPSKYQTPISAALLLGRICANG
jgi:hypothetical protein